MPLKQKIKKFLHANPLFIYFCLSILVWIYCVRGYLLGDLRLISDAVPYFNHIKFFTDNVLQGVYPIWDPTWNSGAPNEFFLRRMGAYNPFYQIVVILRLLGLPHMTSYLVFLGFYYLLGMLGFYFLAKSLLNNKYIAFIGYLLLSFSTMVVTVFGTYIILIFTPMVWFGYFLCEFSKRPQKHSLLGLVFSLMIVMTTYIPFYFATIVLTFLVFFIIIYCMELKRLLKRFISFFKSNKLFTLLCIGLVVLSLLPALRLYQEIGAGEIILPSRHLNAQTEHQVGVAKQTSVEGGVIAMNFAGDLFTRLKEIQIGRFYVPVFIHICLLMAFFVKINRKLTVFICWGAVMYLISVYSASPLYDFLYQHVFFFKYFRNFQYFLWLLLLPLFVMICMEHLRGFIEDGINTRTKLIFKIVLTAILHIAFFIYLKKQDNVLNSSFITVGLSFMFYCAYFLRIFNSKNHAFSTWMLFAVSVIILIQPVEVFNYLNKNAPPKNIVYRNENVIPEFDYKMVFSIRNESEGDKMMENSNMFSAIYYSTSDFYDFNKNINKNVYQHYMGYKVRVYDQLALVGKDPDFETINESLGENENIAFVYTDKIIKDEERYSEVYEGGSKVQIIEGNSDKFRMVKFSSNAITFETNYETDKFLVYNDNFHSEWRGSINKVQVPVYKANLSFKGIWVPAGKSIVSFNFGSPARHWINGILLCVFYGTFIYFSFLVSRAKNESS